MGHQMMQWLFQCPLSQNGVPQNRPPDKIYINTSVSFERCWKETTIPQVKCHRSRRI